MQTVTPKRKEPVQPRASREGEGRLTQFCVRLPEALLARLDSHVRRLMDAAPGVKLSRTQGMLALIRDGLDRAEAEEARKKAAQPPQ